MIEVEDESKRSASTKVIDVAQEESYNDNNHCCNKDQFASESSTEGRSNVMNAPIGKD